MKTIAARLSKLYPKSNSRVGATVTPLLENQVGEYRASFTLAVRCGRGGACSSPAQISPICLRRAGRRGRVSLRSARPSAQPLANRSATSRAKVWSWRLSAACWALSSRPGVATCSSRSRPRGQRFQETALDGWVMAFSLSACRRDECALWPLAGLAYFADRRSTRAQSRAHGSSDAPGARRSRELLIIAEVALTLVLLSAAGLVLKSFAKDRVAGVRLRTAPSADGASRSAEPSLSRREKILTVLRRADGKVVNDCPASRRLRSPPIRHS